MSVDSGFPITILARKLRTCSRLGGDDLRLVGACLAAAWLVRLGLWILPVRIMLRTAARGPRHGFRDKTSAPRIAWAVRVACRYVPRATCLVRALAGQVVMAWHGHAGIVTIGVALREGRFGAHAWLESQGQVLLGDSQELQQYQPIVAWGGRRA